MPEQDNGLASQTDKAPQEKTNPKNQAGQYENHRKTMVNGFIWLEQQDHDYAKQAIQTYTNMTDCPCRDILKSIKEEIARRKQTSGQNQIGKSETGNTEANQDREETATGNS